MTSTVLSVAGWRRIMLIAVTVLAASLALSVSAPQQAHAIMNPNVVGPGHIGWVTTTSLPQCMALTPECMRTPTHAAWRWTGSSWVAARIEAGSSVYVYPYSSPWHWIWTQRTGWLAIQNTSLERGYRCGYTYGCPMY